MPMGQIAVKQDAKSVDLGFKFARDSPPYVGRQRRAALIFGIGGDNSLDRPRAV